MEKKLRQKHHNEYTVTQVEKVETLKKEFLQCPEGEQLPKREKWAAKKLCSATSTTLSQ